MRSVLLISLAIGGAAAAAEPTPTPVPLPDGAAGIGFDDLRFAPVIGRLLAPAGRTGNLALVDPATGAVTVVPGFSRGGGAGGHGAGTTSADEGGGLLFASDRSARKLDVVDPGQRKIVAGAPLAAGPDYVRAVGGEVWVTEPRAKQIEVFTLSGTAPARSATIQLPDGPESLIYDATRKRAYTNEWGGRSHAIDVASHKLVASWDNGCRGSRGIALDEKRGFLFVGCEEGKAAVLDVAHEGKLLSASPRLVEGVDIIAYDAERARLYLPGEGSGTMAILAVSPTGQLSSIAVVPTAKGAHCVAVDDRGGAWVCDPERGRLLWFK